jgi:hypothetical protein
MRRFERIVRQPNVIRIDDTPYRDDAYQLTWNMALRGKRPISLVDMVLRLMLDSTDVRVHYMLTFNPADFSDICRRQLVQML